LEKLVSDFLHNGESVRDEAFDRRMLLSHPEKLQRENESVITVCPDDITALLQAQQHSEDL
jgi:hypothetical protein